MNKRIRQLALQAGAETWSRAPMRAVTGLAFTDENLEKFAELIVKECKENFAKVWYEQGMDIRGAELDKFLTRFEEHFGVEE